MTPSQTAPETVSLLQQPVQNQKYASAIVIQGRSGYVREKPRPRLAMYSSQLPNNQYTNYGQHSSQNQQPISIEPRQTRQPQPQPQMQYLQPNSVDSYKAKPTTSTANTRAFKMPSPPLVPTSSQQVCNWQITIFFRCHMKTAVSISGIFKITNDVIFSHHLNKRFITSNEVFMCNNNEGHLFLSSHEIGTKYQNFNRFFATLIKMLMWFFGNGNENFNEILEFSTVRSNRN